MSVNERACVRVCVYECVCVCARAFLIDVIITMLSLLMDTDRLHFVIPVNHVGGRNVIVVGKSPLLGRHRCRHVIVVG